MTAPQDTRSQAEKAKVLHQLAVEMVIRLNAALKSARIYEPNNLLFQRQIGFLLSLIRKALEESGEAGFRIRSSALFFNNIRLKYGFANYHFFKFVDQEFRRHLVGGIRFQPEVSEQDLQLLMILLVKREPGGGDAFEALLEEAKRQGLQHIGLEKMLASELGSGSERYAAKVFFLGMTHLEETFEEESGEEKIRLGTTRRLMQSIFNHISGNESFVLGLTTLKNFHEYTLNHSMNVCILSIALGRRLGLDRKELVDLGLSAFFHDLGKLDTPHEILEKPAKLDQGEREIIEKHPHQGAGRLVLLKEMKNLPVRAVQVAMEHHLKEDQSGYPRFYRKQTINLFSKIVKIADFFDAITTKRSYRTSDFTREEALTLMLSLSGKEFHPVLLREFAKMIGAYPVGTLVLLSTKELALVFEVSPETSLLLRPKVKLITDAAGNKKDGEIVDLCEVDSATGAHTRTIVKALDPEKYGIRVSDYFLARAS
jgi:HD-GYP domain-containing protein (c-di-GMP phosphodiesterase class II)